MGPLLLHHAVSCGDTNAVRKLIKRQNTILAELSPEKAESLLQVAASSENSFDMAKLLVELGLGFRHTGTNVGSGGDDLDCSIDADHTNKLHVSLLSVIVSRCCNKQDGKKRIFFLLIFLNRLFNNGYVENRGGDIRERRSLPDGSKARRPEATRVAPGQGHDLDILRSVRVDRPPCRQHKRQHGSGGAADTARCGLGL